MFDIGPNTNLPNYGAYQAQQMNTDQLRDVETRHDDMKRLETDVVLLHEIHRDFAGIVTEHGQIIDNIETNVAKTETNVGESSKTLAKAVDLQSANRRKKILCGSCICILIAIAIIITVIVIVTKKNK